MVLQFDYFVGIDWSGAKGEFHRGISVFCAEPNTSLPYKITPPKGRNWSRQGVVDWLMQLSSQAQVLAGIDFAFAHPFADENSYFPKAENSPQTAQALWQKIEQVNQKQPYLYGGGMWEDPVLSAHYNAPNKRRGTLFRSRRRQTEEVAKHLRAPSPTFNCVGPAGVGTGSLAGMRVLHQLSPHAHIWPFDQEYDKHSLVLAEIFPSYYFMQAGIKPVKQFHLQPEMMSAVLTYFNSCGVADDFVAEGPDGDDADALISAAALRASSELISCQELPKAALHEGWIFGVK